MTDVENLRSPLVTEAVTFSRDQAHIRVLTIVMFFFFSDRVKTSSHLSFNKDHA